MSQDSHSEHFAAVQLVEMALDLVGVSGESAGKKKEKSQFWLNPIPYNTEQSGHFSEACVSQLPNKVLILETPLPAQKLDSFMNERELGQEGMV